MSRPQILVDADACPVVRQAEETARRYALPMTILCDEHHMLHSDYAQVRHVSSGADAVDIALINLCGTVKYYAQIRSQAREQLSRQPIESSLKAASKCFMFMYFLLPH